MKLTIEDCRLILTSLEFTRMKFENYCYPTYALRQERLADVNRSMVGIREIRDQLKKNLSCRHTNPRALTHGSA